uniref:Uncharacterized protein n=1 Tax=Arundo donax TaxID=35708 RepID=A0A0A8ZHK0_ARUDO
MQQKRLQKSPVLKIRKNSRTYHLDGIVRVKRNQCKSAIRKCCMLLNLMVVCRC